MVVAQSSNDLQSGFGGQRAKRSLTAAIAASRPGDRIWVTAGTYRPNDEAPSIRWFEMKNEIAIYGVFSGTESVLEQRDPWMNRTILSGDLLGDDADNDLDGLPDPDTMVDNAWHVFFHPESLGLNQSTRLDGFTICGGNASGSSRAQKLGGEIYNRPCDQQPRPLSRTAPSKADSKTGRILVYLIRYCSQLPITEERPLAP